MNKYIGALSFVIAPMSIMSNAAPANAVGGVEGCRDALVMSTYTKTFSSSVNYQMASLITQEDYNQIKTTAGASAMIYGIPVGASYGNFQSRVSQFMNQQTVKLSTNTAENVARTGLDPSSVPAYKACLDHIQAQAGLHVIVRNETKTQATLEINWVPVGAAAPNSIDVTWAAPPDSINDLPKHITAGVTIAVVKRPEVETDFAANYPGFGDSVTLTPYPPVDTARGICAALIDGPGVLDIHYMHETSCGGDGPGTYYDKDFTILNFLNDTAFTGRFEPASSNADVKGTVNMDTIQFTVNKTPGSPDNAHYTIEGSGLCSPYRRYAEGIMRITNRSDGGRCFHSYSWSLRPKASK